ncbi:MAG: YdcF family protein [Kiloniellales bacterium]
MALDQQSTDSARRRRLFVLLLLLLGLLLLAWLAGLLWFATSLPRKASDAERHTDAIVVLTGGAGRLRQGLELLAEQKADKLFVSGVYRGVEVEELLIISQQSPEELQCCVVLGYEADNTRGNAIETATWMREQGFTSLRLVTATYHMPRSLLEFHRAMPEIEIVPHPIMSRNFRQDDWWRWPGSALLLATEYSKYLLARLRVLVAGNPS